MKENVSRPKIYKRVNVTPNDWMKIYEKRKGELVFEKDPTHLSVGKSIVLIPYNFDTQKELVGLPKVHRSIISKAKNINPETGVEFTIKLGDEV